MSKRKVISKYAFRGAALVGLAFVVGWRPDLKPDLTIGTHRIHSVSRAIAAADSTASSEGSDAASAAREKAFDDIDADNRCDSISEQDRVRLQKESGLDLVAFVEESTRAMNGAHNSEEQLQVIAEKFDHQRWSKAWSPKNALVRGETDSRERWLQDTLRLQTSLSHASLFLARYHRILESGVRQEASALRAFHWDASAKQELRREPVRALVRSFIPHVCNRVDVAQYGCDKGETVFRVKALLSPRVSCRFPDKRPAYAAVFWVRVANQGGTREARILEVEANGDRLVKMTYDDLNQKSLLSQLTPNVSENLIDAGLDPFRAPVMWRKLLRAATSSSKSNDEVGRQPASN